MKKIIVSLLMLTASSSAFAWGAKEQGILIGAAGLLGIQIIGGALAAPPPPPIGYPGPVGYAPQPYGYVAPGPSYPRPVAMVPPGVPPPGLPYSPRYRAADMYFTDCNCTRTVMMPDR